jgi:hypothetical protein
LIGADRSGSGRFSPVVQLARSTVVPDAMFLPGAVIER